VIFATVGSMFPFDRFAAGVDEWVGRSGYANVLVQIGSGRYEPKHAKWVRMLKPADFTETIHRCDLLVAHLGMGSIITAMQARKPVLLLPRQYALGEHTSDHQLHGVDWLRCRPGIWIAEDVPAMHRLLDDFVAGRIRQGLSEVPPYASDELLGKVKAFIWAA
jgi:UDP-N-acetylglucosamine transferase subunit ALG13